MMASVKWDISPPQRCRSSGSDRRGRWELLGAQADSISYVETHGTGTCWLAIRSSFKGSDAGLPPGDESRNGYCAASDR